MIKTGIYTFTVLFFLIIILEGSKGLMPFGLVFIIGVLLISGALARFLRGTRDYKRLLKISKIFLFTSLISLTLSYVIIKIQDNISSRNADLLIANIEKYKMDKDIYPDSLKSLIPEYFENLPKAWYGISQVDFLYESANTPGHQSQFDYKLNNLDEYFLVGYFGYIGVENFYYSNEKAWHHDD